MNDRETIDQLLNETIIKSDYRTAAELLDELVRACGEVAVLDYVQRKAWYPANDPPDEPIDVLITVRYRDVRSRPYVIKARFEQDRGGWRTPSGEFGRDIEAIAWTWIPEPTTFDK